ncbi:EAL domain-containing protein [Salinicola sp. JS01]|uniref:bifunctional diguanylate cyclase/phosphodiesterase n=1 Tax=Salinicola sp. JS01 TaxID=3050071 RepID=UPI00255BD5A0|nr:EAL domain-containing protein [Salinicola sp. JS01]WIX32952.1 EAL domain-containing protein [Salinicola sp. JS01]
MSFRRRLLLIMLAVMVVAQLVAAIATLGTIHRDVMHKGGRELEVGLGVMRQLLDERGKQLRDSVGILTSDFGFKSAIASQDVGTLASVLANHGQRVGADMVLLAAPDGTIVASSHHAPGTPMPFPRLWRQVRQAGEATGVVLQGQRPYQFVMLPVRAPNLIGWVGMGFLLDTPLAEEISRLTRLQVSFLVSGAHRASGVPGDTAGDMKGYVAGALAQMPPAAVSALRADLARGEYLHHSGVDARLDALLLASPLMTSEIPADADRGQVYAVVEHSRADLLAVFQALGWRLAAIFAVTLALTALVAAFSARSMSRPLIRLAQVAQKIGRGEEVTEVPADRGGEIGLLGRTLVAMQRDIESRERQQREQVRRDQLTGLANRHSVQQDIAEAVAVGEPFTLLRLSICGFRHINDTFGYAVGDQALRQLAKRLADCPAPVCHAYRLGGDEFLLLVDSAAIESRWLASLREELARPIELDHSPLRLQLVYGEVNFPAHGRSAPLLLRRAEVAMAMAKQQRLGYLRYVEGQDEKRLREMTLVRDLQLAAERGQLSMVYQPKIAAADGALVELEALMRWQHPEFGFIPPDEFITLAESAGIISQLTGWMLDTVCRQLAAWEAEAGLCLAVAVNLSAQDVIDPALPQRLDQALAAYGLDPSRLGLEVTESAIISDPEVSRRVLAELSQRGASTAIDDFGTGYSSLGQLKRLAVRQLKIDKSFILKLDQHSDDRIIVHSTIELGHNLGLEVVAEGVETDAARALLVELGCDYLQGYGISRPLPAAAVADWIAAYPPGVRRPLRPLEPSTP